MGGDSGNWCVGYAVSGDRGGHIGLDDCGDGTGLSD